MHYVDERPHRDRSTGLCECGFVLPLLPPVGRLINNGNAAELLKCQLAARRHAIIFVARRHSAGSTHPCKRNKLCDPSALPGPVLLDTCCFYLSPGGRQPGSAVETRQRRISRRSLQTVAQKAGGELQSQGFAAGSQQTEERNPDGSQWRGAVGGGEGRHALPTSDATASSFDRAGQLGQKPDRPICTLQRPHKGQDGLYPASVR